MLESQIRLRRPLEDDREVMFDILEKSLKPYMSVNIGSSKNLLVIDKKIIDEYIKNDNYFCVVAEINSKIAGWLAGSGKSEILSQHGCAFGDFYIEEIVIDSVYRRKGIGTILINSIKQNDFKAMVVDTPAINKDAIAFYKNLGFKGVQGLPEEFTNSWARMSKQP